jgi:DNA polymerase bacteriophage-type
MTTTMQIDLESRSQVDLSKNGLMRYVQDPSTEVICMAYCFDDGPVQFWWAKEPFPQEVIDHLDSGEPVMAHNAAFERRMFEWVLSHDYNFDPPAPTQWRCSAAISLANGYPAKLEHASEAININHRKNPEGPRLIRDYSIPGFLKEFKPGDANLMRDYCISDVETMREMVRYLRPLSDVEWSEYHLNQRINDRGLPIDIEFCEAALNYADEISADANEKIAKLTQGVVTKHTQHLRNRDWVLERLTPAQRPLLEVYKKGKKKHSLDSSHHGYLLERGDIDPTVREFIHLINDAGSSSLNKYKAAINTHVDGRVHDSFVFHGAQTGRFTGKGIQPHNFIRDAYPVEKAEPLIQAICAGSPVENPASTMSKLLRSMIMSDSQIYSVDWSQIEARVAPWLTTSPEGERKLIPYRAGKDVYVVTAAEMFGVSEADVDGNFRQSGKIAELSLQFGGGSGALINMARNYGVTFTEDEAKSIVKRWRNVNPWAEKIWKEFDHAIEMAVKNPGTQFTAGRVRFKAAKNLSFLWMKLPSGRRLAYPKPKIGPYTTPWGEDRAGPTFQTSTVPAKGKPPIRKHLRGALLFQNATQGAAACLLRRSLIAADKAGLKIIGSIHDEVLGEGPTADGAKLREIMLDSPNWAKSLPLATDEEFYVGARFGKLKS